MASTTPRLGLTKPASGENYSVDVWNNNMTKIDEAVGDIKYDDVYKESSGQVQFTMQSGCIYLVVVDRLNTSSGDMLGLYLVQAHSANSAVRTIAGSSAVSSISANGTTLTIQTSSNYVGVSLVRVGKH